MTVYPYIGEDTSENEPLDSMVPSCDNPTPESTQGRVILGSVVGSIIAIGLFCVAVVFLVAVVIVVCRHRKKHYSVNMIEDIGTHDTTCRQEVNGGKD